jgi:hypothetical protein
VRSSQEEEPPRLHYIRDIVPPAGRQRLRQEVLATQCKSFFLMIYFEIRYPIYLNAIIFDVTRITITNTTKNTNPV